MPDNIGKQYILRHFWHNYKRSKLTSFYIALNSSFKFKTSGTVQGAES